MKISQKDAKLLILLACVMMLGASYFFGYKKYSDKTDEINNRTQALNAQYETLEASNKHRDEYTQKIQENKDKVAAIIAKYPAMVTNQDELYLSKIIEKNTGIWINNFNYTESSIVYTPQDLTLNGTSVSTDSTTNTDKTNANTTEQTKEASQAPATTETTKDGTLAFVGYKNTTQLSFQADYDQMKKLVSFINNYESRKSISSINMAFDNTTGLLTGTVDYNSYSLVSLTSKYTPLIIPSLPMGVESIFGDIVSNKNPEDNKNNE